MTSIQILCYNKTNCVLKNAPDIAVSSFSEPSAFDAFDLVVINLQQSDLWRNTRDSYSSLNSSADINSIAQMISESSSSKVLILLPQNYTFNYNYVRGSRYSSDGFRSRKPLKDIIDSLGRELLRPLLGTYLPLAFGLSTTQVAERKLSSDFHLQRAAACELPTLTTSVAGDSTSFQISERLYATTLLVEDNDALLQLCSTLGLLPDEQEEFPEWLDDVPFLDEEELRSKRRVITDKISELNREQDAINSRLNAYEEKKSILCIKDSALEDRVRGMLAEILHVPNDFEDTKEEDFRYETEDAVYLFEIKGSVGGLRRQHISRTNDHVQICSDDLEDSGQAKRVKGILIFSSQINNPPIDKDPYPQQQLTLAEREEIGVMSAKTFLRCYEASMRGLLSPDEFISLIDSSSGQIEYDTQECR